MEKSDAQDAQSGSKLLKEINAQYAILDSAQNLINQLAQKVQLKSERPEKRSSRQFNLGDWVYSMKDLEKWVLETKEAVEED